MLDVVAAAAAVVLVLVLVLVVEVVAATELEEELEAEVDDGLEVVECTLDTEDDVVFSTLILLLELESLPASPPLLPPPLVPKT